MTFTYNGTLTTDLDYIRFKINDTTSGSGPKPPTASVPGGVNFTDEEIAGLLTIETTKEKAIAALYETLAVAWAKYIDAKIGPRDEKLSQVAARYAALAKEWRDEYGYGVSSLVTGFVTRVDGYSDDIDSGEQ